MPPEATQQQRVEHAWCMQLRGSQAFNFFLSELQKEWVIAHRELTAEVTDNREYQAGRLNSLDKALQLIEKKYQKLKPIVEVVQ